MTDWIVPSNPSIFDVDRAFVERDRIDWSEVATALIAPGDRVFIYQSKPVSAITHLCIVEHTGITSADTLDDREFWGSPSAFAQRSAHRWMRLHGERAFGLTGRARLHLDALRTVGLKNAPQGRRRAPVGVSKLVDQCLDVTKDRARDLVAQEHDLLNALGHPRTSWHLSRGRSGTATSFSAYETALDVPDAATALAMLRVYLQAAELVSTGGWAVSALPHWTNGLGERRFATVSGGRWELFFVWLDPTRGRVSRWGLRFPPGHDEDISVVKGMWHDVADNGDDIAIGETLHQLVDFLDDSPVLRVVRRTAADRARTRRTDWHNAFLSSLLTGIAGTGSSESDEKIIDETFELERRYIERTVQVRQHQAPLREAALLHYAPPRCHYCGLDVREVLDTAHIVADSKGGAASMANVRLLCANHHRAESAGLLAWDAQAQRFVRTPGSAEIPPVPRDEQS